MKKFNKIVMIVLFLIFCVMAVLVHYGLTGSFDAAVYKFVIGFRSDSLTKVLLFITEFASVKGIVSTIFNVVIKNIMMIPRPNILRLTEETGYSFPSGHSMASVAFYGFIIYLILSSNMNKYLKVVISSLIVILIIVIGFSRVYLGVHNASDVIAGYAISTGLLLADIMILKKRGLVK